MISVNQIFEERSKEINMYFDFISAKENEVEEDVFKILKANFILMLYNLLEAIISNSIEEIRIHIYKDDNVDFDCLKIKIKKQIISDLKNISPENFINQTTIIKDDIIKVSFRKDKISNGNIDHEVISDLAEIYGFEVKNSDYNDTNHGSHLSIIKGKRNDLAHGTFSFTEVGKEYSIQDLDSYKTWTLNYLKFILDNVTSYLGDKKYKEVV